jgi:hypothetical protein
LPRSRLSWTSAALAVICVPTTKLRSLPPVLWSVSVRLTEPGMLTVADNEVGEGSMSGATSPVPVSGTILAGESGSSLWMVIVAGCGPTDPGLNEAKSSAFPSGGTEKLD